ncbi:mitochondrial ribosomal protein L44 S homeolog [Xenopus laevis]|nr:mitochondrial ribosomal protein L44 S homeolog [Xenopus laevis]AAH54195.1 MGC64346 protein [Xenopus laevis]
MASLLLGLRSLALSGPRWIPVRGKKRWLRPYLRALEKKLELAGPPKPIPRSQQPNFDYHAEVLAFSQRLNESFSMQLLKTAFVNKTYVMQEEQQRQELGLDKETAMLNLQDNEQLAGVGSEFTASYVQKTLEKAFPNLPPDGIKSLVDHLTSQEVVCHVAQNLAVEDLTLSSECPLDPLTIHRTFFAITGALLQSSGTQRAGLFIRDFLITQLIGKDLFDIWLIADPMSLLVQELSHRNLPLPEPRMTRECGAATVLPVYFVGLYCNKELIAEGPGESVSAAEEEAARVALRKMFGFTENRRPWNYSSTSQEIIEQKAIHSS